MKLPKKKNNSDPVIYTAVFEKLQNIEKTINCINDKVSIVKERDYIDEYEKVRDKQKTIGAINAKALSNARILSSREDALNYMPQNAVCAEVGVAYGDFSRKIIDIMNPKKFYAIDLFANGGVHDFWGRTTIKDSGMNNRTWYENRFKKEIQSGVLETRQGFSWDELSQFPDNYFDYIYLDACHSFDSVIKDIEVVKDKIKEGGYIAFNDYVLFNMWSGPNNPDSYYGVIPAANSLINNSSSKVLFLTLETMMAADLVIQYYS